MKLTFALSTALVLLPALSSAIVVPSRPGSEIQRGGNNIVGRNTESDVQRRDKTVLVKRQRNRGQNRFGNGNGRGNNNGNNNGQGNNQGNNNGNGQNNNNNNGNGQNNNNNNGNGQNGNQGNNEDPQESLNLLPELVAPGLAQDGQDPPVAGQVASLTTKNNFINSCFGQTITNGQQIAGGSCNPVPMGDIIAQANMPSSKFTNPINFSTIPANTPFTASIAVINMDTGFFTNAQKTYYSAPQQLNGNGIVVSHSHIVIQKMGDFGSPDILDADKFDFFKGVNEKAVNGVLSAEVTNGLAPGKYRMASIHTNMNHAPVIVAVAQHGFVDDIVYFEVA